MLIEFAWKTLSKTFFFVDKSTIHSVPYNAKHTNVCLSLQNFIVHSRNAFLMEKQNSETLLLTSPLELQPPTFKMQFTLNADSPEVIIKMALKELQD